MKNKLSDFLPKYSGFFMVAFGVAGAMFPSWFTWVQGTKQNLLLGFIIFCMGMSLQESDIQRIIRHPKDIFIGFCAQYLIMPLSAFLICQFFKPSIGVQIGIYLVACCPGAAASNLVTYLSKGDIAYSICVTLSSTLMAPVVTPLLTLLFLGSSVTVQAASMIKSIFVIVLIPLVLGFLCKRLMSGRKMLTYFQDITPSLSVISLGFIVAGPIAIYGSQFSEGGMDIFLLTILLNVMGYLGGWFAAKFFRMDRAKQVALSIEVGMQNAGLAISLAMNFFGEYTKASLIAAFACAFYAVIGSFVAVGFRNWFMNKSKTA
jgi:BASS family bile acid:Na+ symporter